MQRKFITHEPGERFGSLVVIAISPDRGSNGAVRWQCQCDCGAIRIVPGTSLRNGKVLSCGCLVREACSLRMRKHGLSDAIPEYAIWRDMRNRCQNPRHHAYARYGGRGITVCREWGAFERFFADIGRRPSTSHSLDRIDNNGNYEPKNCRWATKREQSGNTGRVILLTYQGVTTNIAEWARRTGIAHYLIRWRVQQGWPIDRVLTTPSQRHAAE